MNLDDLRAELEDGDTRFPRVNHPASSCWFPTRPDLREALFSSFGMDEHESSATPLVSMAKNDASRDFWEEIRAIERWIKNNSPAEPSLAEGADPGEALMNSLNRTAWAFKIWNDHALPLRLKRGLVLRIYPPRDVIGGVPMIHSMTFEDYAIALVEKLGADKLEEHDRERQLFRWQAAFWGLTLLALFAIAN